MPIISLTFDDALDSHLDVAIPLLDRHGMKGTFFANLSSECLGRRAEEWRAAAASGHELGNHTIFHPASSNKAWVREGNSIESYTQDRMHLELEVANNVLRMMDGKTVRTFAFPCGVIRLGRQGMIKRAVSAAGLGLTRVAGWVEKWTLDPGSTVEDYTPLVRKLFFAARCGKLLSRTPTAAHYDRYKVPSIAGDGQSSESLLATVMACIEMDTWLVYSFHGIGGGHGLYCELEEFESFIEGLSSDPRISVKTFIDAAKGLWI